MSAMRIGVSLCIVYHDTDLGVFNTTKKLEMCRMHGGRVANPRLIVFLQFYVKMNVELAFVDFTDGNRLP